MIDTSAEHEFRERCRVLCARHPDFPRLHTIAAVGAYDAEIGGTQPDSNRLTNALNYILDSGFLIDPGFEIDVVNFREGRDFLREDKKADLVFVSYILKDRIYADIFDVAARKETDPLALCAAVSWRNTDGGWCQRVKDAETKLIVTYGGNFEIGTEIFTYEDYKELIPTPDQECAGNYAGRPQEIRKLYPMLKDIDLPIGWLGFAADPDYLKDVALALNDKTCLGRRALNPDQKIPADEPSRDERVSKKNKYKGIKLKQDHYDRSKAHQKINSMGGYKPR